MYVKAEEVLPADLLAEIQEYVQGVELYIPKRPEARLGWGERNGARQQIRSRNREIAERTKGARASPPHGALSLEL